MIAGVGRHTDDRSACYVPADRLFVTTSTRDFPGALPEVSLARAAVQLADETQARLTDQECRQCEADLAGGDHLSCHYNPNALRAISARGAVKVRPREADLPVAPI